ncbi:unnamed protein product [Bursaphelenchus xylophilus]|uniref:(pine wood nematode) hypothetical protein n=1 Tax=Bursaphelenchus xylophilus TaxID=6326 RepID=A0A1I7RWG9_BURXY|nr:unnamed protein product [Bursaphelenchus xylophilus]CAG9128364.1 unnamed protein product [Bursaphelenchus xylophilus]
MSQILFLFSFFYITLGDVTKVKLNSSFSDNLLQIPFVSDLEFDLEETNGEKIHSEATRFLARRTVQHEEFFGSLLQERESIVARRFTRHSAFVTEFVKFLVLFIGVVTLFLILITVYYLLYPCIHHNNGGQGGLKKFLKDYNKRQTLVHQVKRIHRFVHKSNDAFYLDPKFVHLQVIKKLEKDFLKPRKVCKKLPRRHIPTSKPCPDRIVKPDKNHGIHGTQSSSAQKTQSSGNRLFPCSEASLLLPPVSVPTNTEMSTMSTQKSKNKRKTKRGTERKKKGSNREEKTQESEKISWPKEIRYAELSPSTKSAVEPERIHSRPDAKSPSAY